MQSNALSREVTNHTSESRCSGSARQSRRLAVVEGVSLWLAVLLFFAIQSFANTSQDLPITDFSVHLCAKFSGKAGQYHECIARH